MLPFLLYFAAGSATAMHVYTLLSLGVFGATRSVLELVALAGSVCLIVSAYISLFKPHSGAKVALIAALGSWCFYAPGIAITLEGGWHPRLAEGRVVLLPYLAIGLLALATVYSALASFRKSDSDQAVTWFFPKETGRSVRISVGVCSLAALIGLSGWLAFSAQSYRRPSSRFEIPDGYVGWVRVEFQETGAPVTPEERNQYVYRIPPGGILRTSSPERYGWAKDEYFYRSDGGLRMLPDQGAGGRMVWGKINGEHGSPSGRRQYEEFFVGTEQQFKELAGAKNPGPIQDGTKAK
jgi:hypothetical protein